jgi:L,D-transpeptidase ErfK/SrfK
MPLQSASVRRRSPAFLLAAAAAALLPATVLGNEYALPANTDVVGEVSRVLARQEDTLSDIARAHGAGYEEIVLANPKVDPWLPGSATTVVVPNRFVLPNAPRDGIVLNVAELRLYYFPPARAGEPRRVVTYPVSVGRVDWKTPLGTTRVVRKVTDPTWTPPESIKREHARQGDILPDQVAAGPDNPLGRYALHLGVSGYLLHGTNKPFGIGMRVTHGCVRLYPEDVETLYNQVPVGTPVHLVDQPYKAGWSDGVLYLEAHPPFGEEREGDVTHLSDMVQVVMDATRVYPDYPLDWKRAEAEVLKPSGLPVPIGPRMDLRAPVALPPASTPPRSEAPRPTLASARAPAAPPPPVSKRRTPPERGSQTEKRAR